MRSTALLPLVALMLVLPSCGGGGSDGPSKSERDAPAVSIPPLKADKLGQIKGQVKSEREAERVCEQLQAKPPAIARGKDVIYLFRGQENLISCTLGD